MKKITSVHNETVIEIAKLKSTKERKQSSLFCAEGFKLTKELLSCGYTPIYCFILENADMRLIPEQIKDEIVYIVPEHIMKKISSMSTVPEIITVAQEKSKFEIDENESTILALDCIQDPSNMGTILRSAEAFGINTVLLGDGCCDAYSAKTLRGAMGSTFRLNIISAPLETILTQLSQKNYTIIGTGLDRDFQTVDSLHNYSKKVIVIGNEGNGISNKIKECCDFGMFIPMSGKNESLNAAVAASIILWENKRQLEQ